MLEEHSLILVVAPWAGPSPPNKFLLTNIAALWTQTHWTALNWQGSLTPDCMQHQIVSQPMPPEIHGER